MLDGPSDAGANRAMSRPDFDVFRDGWRSGTQRCTIGEISPSCATADGRDQDQTHRCECR